MDLKYVLRTLSESYGPPAWEEPVVQRILEFMGEVSQGSWRDFMGNLFVKVSSGRGPRILLVAHMDEVAMIVRHVDDRGFLHISPLGGLDPRVLVGQRVKVFGDSAVDGCIGIRPPHLLSQEEVKQSPNLRELFVDIGASSREEVRTAGIRVGSYVTFPAYFSEMLGTRVMGKSFDDRVGCAAEIAVARNLSEESDSEVYAVFTVQEEVGLRGASTLVNQVNPDLTIVLECTVAADIPHTSPQDYVTSISQGAAIRVMDSSMISRKGLLDAVVRVAEESGIPHQLQLMTGGGTDAGRIHTQGRGVPTVVLSTPSRYLHSPNLIIDLNDLDSVIRLATEVASRAPEVLRALG
ncbi:MAG: M42 family metallopeptidase [Aigarchaeota archaeon]|nr:M42 family metallopeptidase [Aigarchaeota archaeon]MDW8092572.1 M42 family metallopeptidase [Nitrososphaerota archaeon]